MYVLIAVLFSVGSFTDPARKALTQQLVPQHELHLAATLDAFTWSLMVRVPLQSAVCACVHVWPGSLLVATSLPMLDCHRAERHCKPGLPSAGCGGCQCGRRVGLCAR
jgi:hypothetical protein